MLVYLCLIFFSLYLFKTDLFSASNKYIKLIHSIIIFSTLIVIVTELFSLFKILNFFSVIIFWSGFILLLGFLLFKRKFFTKDNFIEFKSIVTNYFINNNIYQNILIAIIGLIALLLLIQGIIYPPNNWDSLTYHMSRIMYWIGNESVAHFPTHILRHLYQPPFGEYFILHVNLIQGNDLFANSVQWLFLMCILIVSNEILKVLNVSKTNRLISILLILTIPSVALQASTTKNDIICAFFILCTLFYSLRILKENERNNFILLGLSVGLGMLTKGTFYLFAFPILLFLFIALIKKGISINLFYKGILAACLAVIINIGHFSRNYKIDESVLNIDKTEGKMYSNDKMDGKLFTSNILKNSGLHLGYPIDTIGDKVIRKIHKDILNVPINNPETNYLNIPYDGKIIIITHEDLVPNTIHFVVLVISIILVIIISFFRFNRSVFLLFTIVLLQFFIFCAYLKWQPWHTRLHIPIFILGCILIGLLIEKHKVYRVFIIMILPVFIYSFYFNVSYNNLRPLKKDFLYTKSITPNDKRYKKYFSNQLHLHSDYKKVINLLDRKEIKTIGMSLSDWEYPLLKNFYHDKKSIYCINVGNITAKIPQDIPELNCIVSNQNQKFILFNNKKFYNKTPNNTYIWCYK